MIRSSNKTAKLDETAVFGAMCRHEIPLMFLNIKNGGEKFVVVCYYVLTFYNK